MSLSLYSLGMTAISAHPGISRSQESIGEACVKRCCEVIFSAILTIFKIGLLISGYVMIAFSAACFVVGMTVPGIFLAISGLAMVITIATINNQQGKNCLGV